jgi:uroporphyrinogen III methyltransferase/synthase
MMLDPPLVSLVGAGPGHPGLLTLRAVECLAEADLVLYDKLVPARLLEHARPGAELICVTDLAGCHSQGCHGCDSRATHIHHKMIETARQGKRVVRLKGGDPFLFGRGGEEAEALRAAGIPFEIVPGVTAGLAASACAGIPLTHRSHASAVALVTGHENTAKTNCPLDWQVLARFPGTLVIYMGMSHLPHITQTLLEHGKPADTPAAVIHWGSTGHQRTVEASLAELPAAVLKAGLTSPGIIVIGSVVSLRPQLAWFEDRPLFGKGVLVTRPRRQSGDLVRRLEQLGGITYTLPALDIRPPDDWAPVDRALDMLWSYHWLVFTSANGVHALVGRLRETGRDLRALGPVKLAAIGPATAEALRQYHLEPDLVPDSYRSESLALALRDKVQGQRLLLARADRGREVLRQELATVATVDQVAVYSQVDAVDAGSEALDCLRRGEIDFVTLTSTNIARAFLRVLDDHCRARIQGGEVRLVSISPVTSAAIKEQGLPVAAEAVEYTAAGVVEALVRLAAQGQGKPEKGG